MATAPPPPASAAPSAPAANPRANTNANANTTSTADDGATPRELILEACRRNNTDLLSEVLSSTAPQPSAPSTSSASAARADSQTAAEAAVAALLNTVRDAVGATPLHVAAAAGSLEALDVLLDQPGVETDPRDRLEGDTPLHAAVRFVNRLGEDAAAASAGASAAEKQQERGAAWEAGAPMVEILLDAGCDPRIRNRAGSRPLDLVDVRNEGLRDVLRRAEVVVVEGEGLVDEDEDDDDEGGTPSDSD